MISKAMVPVTVVVSPPICLSRLFTVAAEIYLVSTDLTKDR
jgi:hypothetical protein